MRRDHAFATPSFDIHPILDLELMNHESDAGPANERDTIEQSAWSGCHTPEPKVYATQLESKGLETDCTVNNAVAMQIVLAKPEIGAGIFANRDSKKRLTNVAATKKEGVNSKAAGNIQSIEVKCGQCKETFECQDAMMYHKASYHARAVQKTFCCHLCKRTSTTKKSLQKHLNSLHTGQVRFICPIRSCAKTFTDESNQKQHTNAVHTKEIAFECTKCARKFYRKYHLTRHAANKH